MAQRVDEEIFPILSMCPFLIPFDKRKKDRKKGRRKERCVWGGGGGGGESGGCSRRHRGQAARGGGARGAVFEPTIRPHIPPPPRLQLSIIMTCDSVWILRR